MPWLTGIGCSQHEQEPLSQFFMKTSFITVSGSDFSEELDLKRAAYSYDIKNNPEEYNELVISLVKMLSEEIVLLSAAADKQIIITDREVELSEKEFKKDYPENSFDQILLENAVSYSLWKKRFKKNMIIKKLIDQELKQKIEIRAKDIVEFYNSFNSSRKLENSEDKAIVLNQIANEKDIIKKLRRKKTQEHYNHWIQALYKAYPVEINKNLFKTFLTGINNIGEDN